MEYAMVVEREPLMADGKVEKTVVELVGVTVEK
jgi:hypothetical protein